MTFPADYPTMKLYYILLRYIFRVHCLRLSVLVFRLGRIANILITVTRAIIWQLKVTSQSLRRKARTCMCV
jgi:hypothetical protein